MFTCFFFALLAADPTPEQRAVLKTFRDEFVLITPGEGKFPKSFLMGDDGREPCMRPAHSVTIRYSFSIARYEVPQNLWEAVMGNNPSRWKGERNSVEMVSFAAAQQFCRQATAMMKKEKLIEPNQHVRLPSEAEWEYCARAGTRSKYSFGDDTKLLADYAWYTANAAGNDPEVGAKKANPWGLYDVHGYLWEWCADGWHVDYKGAPNDGSARPAGPDALQGVMRGGSWKSGASDLETARRIGTAKTSQADDLGFRCVLTSAPANVGAVEAGKFMPTAQDKFVPTGAKLEQLWGEGDFTEGPALAPDGSILFSDIGNAIYRYDPKTGKTALFRRPSGRSNGLMFDQQGRLIACEGANTGGGRRISITTGIAGGKDGQIKTLAEKYDGKRFNSPNDLAIDSKGRVYFTDPRYVGDEPRELDFEGVFLVGTDGSVQVATREAKKPNGILVSPDGTTVYVSENNPQGGRQLLAFAVKNDGALEGKRVLWDFGTGRGIDGMTLDTAGNIFATAGTGDKAGLYVFAPDGKNLAFLPTPGDPTNCCFGGGDDAGMLYITCANAKTAGTKYGLYRVKLKGS